jgi:tripartite-type tricarboxylate transporter receptor subunit TctC
MIAARIPCSLATAAVAVMLATSAARTQDAAWPQRTIRLIVNTAAGGAADTTSRIVTQKLTERLGWTIVIENQAGASGRVGVQNVARAAPDGYTFGILTASSNAITAALGMDLPYKPVDSFAPVSLIGGSPYVLAVHPGTGINSLADLVASAKAKPGQLNNGTFGLESVGGMASVWLESLADIRFNSIPYRSTAQAVVDVVSGRIDMQFGTLPPTVALIKDGRIRGIGVTGRNRAAALPAVPTFIEQSYPNFEAVLWQGIAAPAGTPTAIIARFNREMTVVLNMPEVRQALLEQGFDAEPGPPEAMLTRLKNDIERWRAVAAKANLARP